MFYDTDLSYIHDAGYGDLARAAAAELLHQLGIRGIGAGLVVDLGCGSGILAEILLEAGYQVWGADQSEAMIDLAKKRAPQAEFVVGSLWETGLPLCQAVVSSGECLNYCVDRPAGEAPLNAFFHRVYDALLPGGLFLFDVATPGLAGPTGAYDRMMEGDDWTVFVSVREDRALRSLSREITLFRQQPESGYRRTKETHLLTLFDPESLFSLLGDIGFHVTALDGYRGLTFRAGHTGILACRPN